MYDNHEEFIKKFMEDGEFAKDKLRIFFRKLTKEERLIEFRLWDNADLSWVCKNVALPTEDYDIGQGAYDILKDRAYKHLAVFPSTSLKSA